MLKYQSKYLTNNQAKPKANQTGAIPKQIKQEVFKQ
jgi:hypothetical protein